MKTQEILLLLLLFAQIYIAQPFGVSDDDDSYTFPIELKEIFNKDTAIKDEGKVIFDDSITGRRVVDEMGFGWNLGNTFDAWNSRQQDQGLDSEISWGITTRTTEQLIKGLVNKGIKTIRIPVTWHNHIIDNNYTIDPAWMKRVKEVVDWCINNGLYVIINTHHDNCQNMEVKYGQGYYPLRENNVESETFLYNTWRQIALAFNNGYDHHLIFEGLNEPRLIKTSYEWNFKKGDSYCEEASSVINEYLKLIVKAIRTTGGNNEKRFIMVTPIAAAYASAVNQDFIFPGDSKYNPTNSKILLSVHMYLPYNFAMNADMSYKTFEESYANELYSDFKNLYETFILKGHNVIIGEMGVTNKNNTEERIKYAKYYVSMARKFNIPCIVWDNENFNNRKSAAENFGLYKRSQGYWEPDSLISAYVEAAKTKMEDNPVEEFKDTLLSTPFEFKDWKQNVEVGVGTMSSFNTHCKLILETDVPSYTTDYQSLTLFLADWSKYVDITQDEVKGGNASGEGGISFSRGPNTITVSFNEKNLEIVKQRGLYIIGHGFRLVKLSVEGPKLVSFEPKNIIKSTTEVQRVSLTFSQDASDLVGNIRLVNKFYNLNKKLACIADTDDKKVVHCEGLYDFTGEYQITDEKGILLTLKEINVLPKEGEKKDINNLLSEKFLFDITTINPGVKLASKLFAEVNEKTTLVLETTDLNIEPSQRILYVLKGNSESRILFDAANVDTDVKEDGAIVIPKGNSLTRITLGKNYELFMENGVTLVGYGFGLKTVFLE